MKSWQRNLKNCSQTNTAAIRENVFAIKHDKEMQ
jgi:hypothetical protein